MGAQELGWLPGPALTVWGHLPDNPDILWVPFSALATFQALGVRGQGKLRPFLQPQPALSHEVIFPAFTVPSSQRGGSGSQKFGQWPPRGKNWAPLEGWGWDSLSPQVEGGPFLLSEVARAEIKAALT